MKSQSKAVVTVTLDPDTYSHLKQEAKCFGISISAFTRFVVTSVLFERHERKQHGR